MNLPFQLAVLPVTPFQQNCTVLWDEASRRAVICDPGGDAPRIMAAIAQLQIVPEKIVLTHGHLDHAGGAAELRELLQAQSKDPTLIPIEGPDERDAFLLADLQRQGEQFGMRGLRNVTPDRWLKEGDTVDLAGHEFRVLHCPGHTPGHVVLVHGEDFAFMGDVLFRGSVGRTDFPYGNHDQLIASIHEKLMPLRDELAFICGHGPNSTIGMERRSNPFLQ